MAHASTARVLVTPLRGSVARDAALVLGAVVFIAASAQVAIPLPFSPVPLTGQTFAVLLMGAALGPTLGLSAAALYMALALAGLPVLAPTADGVHVTGAALFSHPTLGYLAGFMLASFLVGRLAERGYSRTPLRVAATMAVGNVAIYALGLLWLGFVTGGTPSQLLAWGLLPFLLGDAVKVALAAGLLPAAWSLTKR